MSTIGEQLVHVDRQTGVTRVYDVVDDSLNPFVDAIRPTKGIDWIVLDAENSP
jgi:pyruvate dehydrogenase (quinone)